VVVGRSTRLTGPQNTHCCGSHDMEVLQSCSGCVGYTTEQLWNIDCLMLRKHCLCHYTAHHINISLKLGLQE